MLNFQNENLKSEFKDIRLNELLRFIVFGAAAYCEFRYREPLWVTSVNRPEPGIHGLWRAVDCDNDYLQIWQKKDIAEYINGLWIYDPYRMKYQVCLHHTVEGRGGDHFHFQVHPFTIFRRKISDA